MTARAATTSSESAGTAPASLAAGDAAATQHDLNVLLVDDSPILCERLSALINQLHQPIRVAVAADGVQAVALFEQLHPDAVVLDIDLPDRSGFELLAQFKRRRPGCVVIMLTTYVYQEFKDNARRLGADHFFDKAMEFERVIEVLGDLMAPLPPPA
jgi:CheY-like chemotaxis protein